MGPVPRDPNMLEDYRFEAINAGQGPETNSFESDKLDIVYYDI